MSSISIRLLPSVNFEDYDAKTLANVTQEINVALPSTYVVIDIVTTGLDADYNALIEVAAIRYKNNEEIERFSELIKPYKYQKYSSKFGSNNYVVNEYGEKIVYIDEFITKHHSITNEMLYAARCEADVINDFVQFVGKDMIVGHCTGQKMKFLYDAAKKHLNISFNNPYVCISKIARKLMPKLWYYELENLCNYYSIRFLPTYRALDDAYVIKMIYNYMYDDIIYSKNNQFDIVNLFMSDKRFQRKLCSKDIHAKPGKLDPDNFFYNRNVCITGKLELWTRAQATQYLKDIGGNVDDDMYERTEFLVIGNNDCNKAQIKGDKSRKQLKAEEAILKGRNIKIISENMFYELIGVI